MDDGYNNSGMAQSFYTCDPLISFLAVRIRCCKGNHDKGFDEGSKGWSKLVIDLVSSGLFAPLKVVVAALFILFCRCYPTRSFL